MINNAMAKFADIQKGIFDTQYEISGKPPKQTEETPEPQQAISLIDLDDGPSESFSSPQQTQQKPGNVMDDLSELFGQSASVSSPATTANAGFNLGSLMNVSPPPQQHQQHQQPPVRQEEDPLAFLGRPAIAPPPAVSPTLSSSSMGTPVASGHASQYSHDIPAGSNGHQIAHPPSKLSKNSTKRYTALLGLSSSPGE